MKTLRFRAPGQPVTLLDLIGRAWPRASRKQRLTTISSGRVRVAAQVVRDPAFEAPAGALLTVNVQAGSRPPQAGVIEVIAEGDGWCVVDKPVGWPSHRTAADAPDLIARVADALSTFSDAAQRRRRGRLDPKTGPGSRLRSGG